MPSTYCSRTAPTALPEASVVSDNGTLLRGKLKLTALFRAIFEFSKASNISRDHFNFFWFKCITLNKGAVISEKEGMKRRK